MAGDRSQSADEKGKHSPQVEEVSLYVGEAEVHIRAALPPDTQLKVTLETIAGDETARKTRVLGQRSAAHRGQPFNLRLLLQSGWQRLRASGWEGMLLALALLLYLAVRLIRIDDFPIYFFTDEAVQTVQAADLVRDGFYSAEHEFLPTYFYNGYQYNLSTSVYLQVLPYMLFGKSVVLTRAVAACATLLGALAVGLIIRRVFAKPHAWSAVLLFSITPAWFLHSRTAFETGLSVTFYAVFLYFYLSYRTSNPRNLYPAILAAALTFYSYSPARVVIGVTAVLLFFSDLKYHYRQRKTILIGLGLILLLALPFIRFYIQHPTSGADHLRVLNSYWVQPLPAVEKMRLFFEEYLGGLNPFYWFMPNTTGLERHIMKGYGHVLWYTFPLLAGGLVLALKNIRKPAYRALLLALLAVPSGAALVAVGITRLLTMVVPLALLSALGLVWLLEWLGRQGIWSKKLAPVLFFIILCSVNIYMTADALTNGPLWFQNYGLAGMQWGAKQIFAEAADLRAQNPDERVVLSPSWANGTDTIARFFFADPLPFQMASIEGYFYDHLPLDENTLFIMIPREYELMLESGKFSDVRIEKTLAAPNGEPAFYFVRLQYTANIDAILEAERNERRALQTESVTVGDAIWQIRYSYLDMGSVDKLFDGNPDSLIRTMEANPLVVEMAFPQAKPLKSIALRVGGTPTRVSAVLTSPDGSVITIEQTVEESPIPRSVVLELEEVFTAAQIHLEVLSIRDKEPAHVHLWEITIGDE